MTYINKDLETIYVELDTLLDQECNYVGSTWDDYMAGAWVLLSDEQLAFHEANPEACPEEVFNMQLTLVPEPTPEERLQNAQQEKIRAIMEYDYSSDVNSFFVNGVSTWLAPEIRANYKNSIESAELLGETEITFIIANIPATSTLLDARIMLAKIQRYADKCTIRTEMHKANIRAMTTVEAVEAYDYTIGYPEKERFTITQIA